MHDDCIYLHASAARGSQLLARSSIKRVKGGRLYLIPASEETRGHATTGMAKFYQQQPREFLAAMPRRAM
jgi:homoserine O-acetyltransferase